MMSTQLGRVCCLAAVTFPPDANHSDCLMDQKTSDDNTGPLGSWIPVNVSEVLSFGFCCGADTVKLMG